jgi:hypothetical protein
LSPGGCACVIQEASIQAEKENKNNLNITQTKTIKQKNGSERVGPIIASSSGFAIQPCQWATELNENVSLGRTAGNIGKSYRVGDNLKPVLVRKDFQIEEFEKLEVVASRDI